MLLSTLKTALTLERLSQRSFAQRVGIREETLSRVIHGRYRPSYDMKKKIAGDLGRPVQELFAEEPGA
jgi:transcriptional regulator with XRE-family HTH domain